MCDCHFTFILLEIDQTIVPDILFTHVAAAAVAVQMILIIIIEAYFSGAPPYK